jgi:polyhydroxyalkanoate synthesis regulator phasin
VFESLRNSLLASLGFASLAQEKLQAVVKELTEKGELQREQAKRLLELFAARGEKESQEFSEKIAQELARCLERTPIVSRQEFLRLEERVRTLEAQAARAMQEDVEAPGGR